jgi:hypothetical protein
MLYGHWFQQYRLPLKTQFLHSGLSKSRGFLLPPELLSDKSVLQMNYHILSLKLHLKQKCAHQKKGY